MTRKRVAGLLLTAVCGLGAAACGGSSAPTGGSTSNGSTDLGTTSLPTGAGSFTSKANAVCKSIGDQIAAVHAPGDPSAASSSDLGAWAHYLQQTIPLITRGTSQLEGLIPPAAQQADYDTLIRSDQKQLNDAQAAEQAASAGDLNGFKQATQKIAADGAAGDSAAKSVGLSDCVSGG